MTHPQENLFWASKTVSAAERAAIMRVNNAYNRGNLCSAFDVLDNLPLDVRIDVLRFNLQNQLYCIVGYYVLSCIRNINTNACSSISPIQNSIIEINRSRIFGSLNKYLGFVPIEIGYLFNDALQGKAKIGRQHHLLFRMDEE